MTDEHPRFNDAARKAGFGELQIVMLRNRIARAMTEPFSSWRVAEMCREQGAKAFPLVSLIYPEMTRATWAQLVKDGKEKAS